MGTQKNIGVKRKTKVQYKTRSFFGDLWQLLEGQRARYIFFTIILGLSEFGPFIMAYLLGAMVDFFTLYESGQDLTRFYTLVILIGLTGSLQVISRMWAKMNCSIVGAKNRQKVREVAMSQLMNLELSWHEKEDAGSKIQKINVGSAYIYRFFSDFTNNHAIPVIIGIGGSFVLFLFVGLQYALFALAYTAIFLTIEHYYSRKLSYWTDEMNKISEKVSGKFHESTSNVLSVKSLGLRKVFENSTKKYEDEYYRIWYQTKKTSRLKMTITKVFASVGYALFMLLVGYDVIMGALTLGSILVFSTYFGRLRYSLDRVSGTVDGYIDIKSAIGRLMTILGKKAFDRESEDLLEVPKNWRKIEFSDVSFRYKKEPVLNGFNLTLKRGEKIGIVGRSGCGKSTITKLLLGLYKVKKGKITIDGVDINNFKHSSITNNITAVLQDSEMFDMSLAENISISSLGIDKSLLKKAMNVSLLTDVVKKLPKGINTLLGEKGYKVSGGERQRIGIARAVYKNAPCLILDEATSHLDSKTEKVIQENLETELASKTMIVIAHRLSTIKNVDRIIVMEKGKIIEEGTFKELLQKKGSFNNLYRIQRGR